MVSLPSSLSKLLKLEQASNLPLHFFVGKRLGPDIPVFRGPSVARKTMQKNKVKLAVLGSGKGSNLDALAKYCACPDAEMEIVLVASDVEGAGILGLAQGHGLKTLFIP